MGTPPVVLSRARAAPPHGMIWAALSAMEAFVIGASCRAVADCLMYPTRVLKVRAQGEGHKNKTLGAIVKNEGVGALYKGLVPTAARQVPLNMVRFISVEAMKKLLANVD